MKCSMCGLYPFMVICFVAVATLVLPGCPDQGPVVVVRGKVTLGEPIANTDIAVYQGDTLVHTEHGETGRYGTFLLHIPLDVWQEDFILKATGGTIGQDGPPFTGTMSATVKGHDESHSFYDLNPVTTIVTEYMSNHPDMSYEVAETSVKAFLAIPEYVDILTDLVGYNQYFDGEVFLAAMEQAESWDAFFQQLALMVDDESIAAYPFLTLNVEKGFMAGLAAGAGQEIGSRVTGWALDSIFGLEGGGASEPDVMGAIEDVRGELAQIRNSIQQMNSALERIKNVILTAQQQQSYNVLAALMDTDVSTITTFHQRLVHLLGLALDQKHSNAAIRDEITRLVHDIQKDDLLQRMNHIHNVLTGAAPGQQGMYELYDNVLFAISFENKHFDEMAAFYTYWSQIQVQALNLLLEVDHFLYPNEPLYAELYLDTYIENIKGQSNLYLKAVEKQLSVVWGPYESAAAVLNWNYYDPSWNRRESHDTMTFSDTFNLIDYQNQSTPLLDADNRVAAMQGKERSTIIRIFVGKAWGDTRYPWGGVDLNDTAGDLKLRDSVGNLHSVERLTVFNVDQSAWTDHLLHFRRQMARYDFGALPDGYYQITNSFNNAHPIPPVQAYGTNAQTMPIRQTYMDYIINPDVYNPVNNVLILFGGAAFW